MTRTSTWLGILLAILLVLLGAQRANAAPSWFQFEAGLGGSYATGQADGIWYQHNVPGQQSLTAPAYLAGITGQVWNHEPYDIRYHLDYLYLGDTSASCDCVSDADYANHNYNAARTHFSGHGHTQGLALTLDPGYTYSGWRVGVEAGVFGFWPTWHEAVGPDPAFNASHRTTFQTTWIAGASLSRGSFSLRYLYFHKGQSWNPYPQYTGGAHILLGTWRF